MGGMPSQEILLLGEIEKRSYGRPSLHETWFANVLHSNLLTVGSSIGAVMVSRVIAQLKHNWMHLGSDAGKTSQAQ